VICPDGKKFFVRRTTANARPACLDRIYKFNSSFLLKQIIALTVAAGIAAAIVYGDERK
jgi:hypothetical protein